MPNFNDTINNFGCGNDLIISRSISGIPPGKTLILAWLYVKRELSDLDTDAMIQKRIDITATDQGQVLDDGNSGPGLVVFVFNEPDTSKLTQPAFFEIRVETSDGFQYTSNRGVIRGQTSVMNSAS